MEILKKIADKAREAKTQFNENRRAEKASDLAQTEQRLENLQAQLKEKESLLIEKERTLRVEESRLRRISRRPRYVLIICTLGYSAITIAALNRYDLVARAPSIPDPNSSTIETTSTHNSLIETGGRSSTVQGSVRTESVKETYRGIDTSRPNFDVGRYCLNAEKQGHITFEQCIGMAATKIISEKAK